jgi:threonine aldolase
MGTVYQPGEIRELAEFAHERGMFLHVDGARIANAAVSLGQTLRQATRDLGVDVLSFGGTKNGILGGEAVVFFDRALSKDFLFLRKQGMQLASKMRFIAAQFEALLTNDLWKRSAEHANRMARVVEAEVRNIPQVRVVWPVEANGVFAQIPRHAMAKIKERYFFYPWIEEECIVRWMCSFDTTEEDVRDFVSVVVWSVDVANFGTINQQGVITYQRNDGCGSGLVNATYNNPPGNANGSVIVGSAPVKGSQSGSAGCP